MSAHDTDDEFGRRLSLALHRSVPTPPADLLTELPIDRSSATVRPLRRPRVARRAAPWLAAAAVVLIGAAVALVATVYRGGGDHPAPVGRSSGTTVSCLLGDATVVNHTATPRRLTAVLRLAVRSTIPCMLPTRPEVTFIGRSNLPFLPAQIVYGAGADATVRVAGRAAEFTLVLDAGCADPQRYSSLTAGSTYGGLAPVDLAGTVCSAHIGDYRPVG